MNLARLRAAAPGHGSDTGDGLRDRLWPLPAAAVATAACLGVGLPQLDAAVSDALPAMVTRYLFGGGPGAARAVLEAVAGSLITVTALTFSLTVVTLQLASSQFSPRLLRTFSRDRVVHVTLALFLATFTYALTVLRTVRDPDGAQSAFVPQISVTVAYLLTLVSVLTLVLFLAHLVREIRVETMLRTVRVEALATLRHVLDDEDRPPADPAGAVPVPPAGAAPLLAASSGFLVRLDEAVLLSAAVEADAVVIVDRFVGEFLVAGTPLGAAWSPAKAPLSPAVLARLADRASGAVAVGTERTETQDVGYGLRQLTDVATKALSPGINDPTTAVHALGHVSALLCEFARHHPGPRLLHDGKGRVRVVLLRPRLDDLLETALGQPRRYGAGDPVVLDRLFWMLREVGWVARTTGQADAVAGQLARLRATAADQQFDAVTNGRMNRLAALVEEALAGRWPPCGTR